jgi:hypothetical protein
MTLRVRCARSQVSAVLSRLPQLLRDRAEDFKREALGQQPRLPPPTGPSPNKRPYLTAEQDRHWRGVWASARERFRKNLGLSAREAGARAAKLAWGVLRKRFGSVITKKRLLAEAYAARAGRRSDRPADVTRAVAGAVVRALAGLFRA